MREFAEATLRFADRIERAIEREAVEIIGDDDARGRARHAVELEEGLRRVISRRHFRHRFLRAVRHQHNVGRRLQRRQAGDAARNRLGYASTHQFRFAHFARGQRRFRQP